MKKYSISGYTTPHYTYNTYPTWWRRVFNRPVVKTISYYQSIRLVVESDVPLNNLKYVDGNVLGPCFEDVSTTPYIVTSQATFKSVHADLTEDNVPKFSAIEAGRTNLLLETATPIFTKNP